MATSDYEFDRAGRTLTCTIAAKEVSHLDLADAMDDCMAAMRNDGASQFIFDLSAVEHLASACIGVLVQFLQDIEAVRGRIALVGCQDNVKFLFRVTRLDHVFELFDDVDDARRAL